MWIHVTKEANVVVGFNIYRMCVGKIHPLREGIDSKRVNSWSGT